MSDMASFHVVVEIENPARWTGPAFVYAAGTTATDDVVFGEPTDMILLGARSLEGLNLRIDVVSKRLADAGPVSAAAA
jgi:hypothetical protein